MINGRYCMFQLPEEDGLVV